MPYLPHLALPRVELEAERKKKRGYGSAPARDHKVHGEYLTNKLGEILAGFRQRERPVGIDPSLIIRVALDEGSAVSDDVWERSQLRVLSRDQDKTLVLFSSDTELSEFRERLGRYVEGPTGDQKSAPHEQTFAAIDEFRGLTAADRIGPLLRSTGIEDPDTLEEEQNYSIDVELWDLGRRQPNQEQIARIRRFIETLGGRVSDQYLGDTLILLRVHCRGRAVKELLQIEQVALIDLPPSTTLRVSELLDVGIADFEQPEEPPDNAPGIAILDSGLTSAHPCIRSAVGEATAIPLGQGDAADYHGHGTKVAGLALYGSVEDCIASRSFSPRLRLYSARVLNSECQFDDEYLITTQMRQAIEYFHTTYGCRVFNLSLGDPRLPYNGGKVSPWASVLDSLARQLDIVIIVSAGNYEYGVPEESSQDAHLKGYPAYLLTDAARIIEPATGLIVVTVGALTNGASVPPGAVANSVAFRPIAPDQGPAPFTRSGPGPGGAIKPELCEIGGNWAYDGVTNRLRKNLQELGVVSTNHQYVDRLFATACGTSFAAPKVAHMAAQLYGTYPEASANLIRALLTTSARPPDNCREILEPISSSAVLRLCGYGRPDLETAQASDKSRVVLWSETTILLDGLHIYELPIPDEFIEEKGMRRITITLAYDPPVRHTRTDYLGTKMTFRLIRGKSVHDIAEAYRRRSENEPKVESLSSTKYDCKAEPKARTREAGTLQKATFTMMRKPAEEYGHTYHVLIRCEKQWAGDEHAPQRYAVVVGMEHSADIDLYAKMEVLIRQIQQQREKQRARV